MKKFLNSNIFLSIFFISLSFFTINAQQIIRGIVLSRKTGTAIESAHVFIKTTSLGTITNSEGGFTIKIPNKFEKGILKVSSLGFETKEFNINELLLKEREEKLILLIDPVAVELEEIVISTKKELSALKIVQNAFDNYSDLSAPYLAKGFVRHTEKSKEEFKWLVEAAFHAYDSNKNNIYLNILEKRKSVDNRVLDTTYVIRQYLNDKNNNSFKKNRIIANNYKDELSVNELAEAFNYYNNHFTAGYNKNLGLLEKIISTDINKIRNFNRKNASFTRKNLKDFRFKKDTIFYLEGDKVFKINFSLPNKRSNEIAVGWFLIKEKNYTFIELDYTLVLAESHHHRRATGNKIKYNTNIKYKVFNNIHYPFYISHKSFKSNGVISNSRGTFEGNYTHQEILFTEIIDDIVEINKVTKNINNVNSNLFRHKEYNNDFWENYTVLLESENEMKMIQDLEKKVNLKKQFEKK